MGTLVIQKNNKFVLLETPFKAKPDVEMGVGGLVGFDTAKTSSIVAGVNGSFVLVDAKFNIESLNFNADNVKDYQKFRSSIGFSIMNQNICGTKIKDGIIIDNKKNEQLMTLTLDISYFFLNQTDIAFGAGINSGGLFHLNTSENQVVTGPNLQLVLYPNSDWSTSIEAGSLLTVNGEEDNYMVTLALRVFHNFMK